MQRVWFGLLVVSAGAVWGASADLEIATAGNWSRDEFRSGTLLFSDRTYRLAQPPAVLDGKAFVRAPIDGMRVTSRTAGTVCALTPRRVPHATSLEESLTRQGFVRDASIPLFSLFGTNEHEKVYAYRKDVKAGESFRLRKWAVLVDVGAGRVSASGADGLDEERRRAPLQRHRAAARMAARKHQSEFVRTDARAVSRASTRRGGHRCGAAVVRG